MTKSYIQYLINTDNAIIAFYADKTAYPLERDFIRRKQMGRPLKIKISNTQDAGFNNPGDDVVNRTPTGE